MSEKRRDNKKRILRNGESQRKDGRYAYTYVDSTGKQKFLYSWKLESTDKLPAGKRDCVALREKIKQLERDLADGITNNQTITVAEICDIYEKQKRNLKKSSVSLIQRTIVKVKNSTIANTRVKDLKTSQAKQFILDLYEQGLSYSYVARIKSMVKSILAIAVEDKIIRDNPFDFKVGALIKNNTKPKPALTEKQQDQLLDFIKNDPWHSEYYNHIYLLFNTGLRISEFCGLTVEDIDMNNMVIDVNKQLLFLEDKPNQHFYFEETKTRAGVRKIPFSPATKIILQDILQKRKLTPKSQIGDGYYNILFTYPDGTPYKSFKLRAILSKLQKKYNKQYPDDPIYVTPHICRHTFCSRMAEKRMNPKALQYIMGHSDIQLTLNVYTHVTFESVCKEFLEIAAA